jgi:hypothetical protein
MKMPEIAAQAASLGKSFARFWGILSSIICFYTLLTGKIATGKARVLHHYTTNMAAPPEGVQYAVIVNKPRGRELA